MGNINDDASALDDLMEEMDMKMVIDGKTVRYSDWPQIFKDKLKKRIDDAFENK